MADTVIGGSLKPDEISLLPLQEAFTFRPIIHDILRTRFCVPQSIFVVENIDIVPVSKTGRWRVIRLLLGDGELCIQSVLSGPCHRFVETGEVFVGSYVRLDNFDVEWVQNPDDGDSEGANNTTMVFLVVKDIETLGWNQGYREMAKEAGLAECGTLAEAPKKAGSPTKAEPQIREEFAGLDLDMVEFEDEQATGGNAIQKPTVVVATLGNVTPVVESKSPKPTDDFVDFDMDDEFGALDDLLFPSKSVRSSPAKNTPSKNSPSKNTPTKNSPSKDTPTKTTSYNIAALQNTPSKPSPLKRERTQSPTKTSKPQAVAMPRDWEDHTVPLKLTTLYNIPNLPYSQNWSCNVLAIVTSLSAVEGSYLPPYKQRTARIADPSTAKQVHLTVFLDPESFNPVIGSAVLLTGVKNHQFDGGSLKKYASDKNRGGNSWWFENPLEMTWCDVRGIKDWWRLMELSKAS